jgi:hypothetical protein
MLNALRGLRGVTGNFLYVPQCCSVRITKVFFEVPKILVDTPEVFTDVPNVLTGVPNVLTGAPNILTGSQCPFYPWAGLKGQNVEEIKINQPF